MITEIPEDKLLITKNRFLTGSTVIISPDLTKNRSELETFVSVKSIE